MFMNQRNKRFSILILLPLLLISFFGIFPQEVKATAPIQISPICDFTNSLEDVNNSRDHWNGPNVDNSPGNAIDFGITGISGAPITSGVYGNTDLMCANSDVLAAFSGTLTYADDACGSTMAVLTNAQLNLKLWYIHLDIQVPNGSSVSVGDKIGSAAANGCADGYVHNHILLKKYSDNSNLTYSSQYTTTYPNQWEFSYFDGSNYAYQPHVWPSDVNGDNDTDLVGIAESGIYTSISNGDGTFQKEAYSGGKAFKPSKGWFSTDMHPRVWVADVNGDARDDLMGVAESGLYVAIANGNGTFQNESLAASYAFKPSAGWFSKDYQPRVWPAKVNADNCIDLIGVAEIGIRVALSNCNDTFQDEASYGGKAFKPSNGWFSTDVHPRVWVSDINADGKDDLMGIAETGLYVAISNGNGSYQNEAAAASYAFRPSAGWFSKDYQPRVWPADVDGNHCHDLIGVAETGIRVAKSNCNGTFQDETSYGGTGFKPSKGWFDKSTHKRVWVADANGDHKDDLMGIAETGLYVALATSGGAFQNESQATTYAFTPSAGWFNTTLQPRVWPADIDGDVDVDLIGVAETGLYVSKSLGNGFFNPESQATTYAFKPSKGWFN
jgi:hypothetical protein